MKKFLATTSTLGFAVGALIILSATTSANAAPISGLYNTGVDNDGAVLANGAAETHYSLASVSDGSSPGVRVATSANGFPIGPWVADDSLSAWIGPNSDQQLNGLAYTYYDYRVSFSLAGFNSASASITGQWAADNEGTDILVNGVFTGDQTSGGFNSFTSFTISSGFVDGTNTLDFIVYNDGTGGPTGLRVEMTGTADVPEPASVALFGAGLLGINLIRRRRA